MKTASISPVLLPSRASLGRRASLPLRPEPDAPTFDSLLGKYLALNRKFLSSTEIATLLHRGRDFVEALIESGELDAHTAGPNREKDRKRITIASVARYLANSALYDESETHLRLRDLFATWTPAQRRWALEELTRLTSDPRTPHLSPANDSRR